MWKHSAYEIDKETKSEADFLLNDVLLNQNVLSYS